ncbi:MAG: hypothetical protein R3C14_21720 [Caldilineaceae bacterium]
MQQAERSYTVALLAIARPTFDVPLAQSVADTVLAQLEQASCTVIGARNRLLMDREAAETALAALQKSTFDVVILLQASFADSSMAVQLAEALRPAGAPFLLWAVPDERTGGRLRLNSLCGINLAGHALHLRGIPYEYLLLDAAAPEAIAAVQRLGRVGQARRQLHNARIGLVGEHPAGFDTCAYVPNHLAELFGVEVVPIALAATLQQAATVAVDPRQRFIAQVGEYCHNLAELDQNALAGTASVYAALRQLTTTEQLSGVAVRCWPEFFTELGCAACGAMSVLNEEQCPASCEADVNGTVTSLLLQALSQTPTFITDLVSIDRESDTGVLWHCGLAPVSMADPVAEILGTVHSNRKLPLLFEFPLKPGRVTIARLHRTTVDPQCAIRDSYQLVIGGGEMVRAPKSFSGSSGVLRFDQPATTVFDRIMRHGLEHHFNITYGDYRTELRTFAALVGVSVLELT